MRFEGPGELPPREQRVPIPDDFDDYVAAAAEWLGKHWSTCANCGPDAVWRIQAVAVLLSSQGVWPKKDEAGAGFSLVPITCTGCGRMEFVNAFYIFRLPP